MPEGDAIGRGGGYDKRNEQVRFRDADTPADHALSALSRVGSGCWTALLLWP